ncbi:MAG: peptide chain release factor 2 [Actinophytocola sp.]|nr:peptide chain release factor 2 [Actinophytocola sp.]
MVDIAVDSGLRDLVARTRQTRGTPFASMYYESSHTTEDATKVLELTWRELADDLRAQGADADTVAALEDAVWSAPYPAGRSGRALIAAGGAVLVDRSLGEPPARPVARWSTLPYLVPLVAHAPPSVAHVVVTVDKVGAEMTGVDSTGAVAYQHPVLGSEHPVHEAGTNAGLPRRHDREHVQETVKQNIHLVADDVTKVADAVSAELIVISGEVKGRRALRDALPDRLRDSVVDVGDGGRTQAPYSDALGEEVDSLVAERERQRIAARADQFRAELAHGTDGLAVQGISGVCAALREANVEALLIGSDDDQHIHTGADPIEVAADPEMLDQLGISVVDRDRADEALPLAAIAVGADLLVVGDDLALEDGFGALLRYR